jgi:hypothetical protein
VVNMPSDQSMCNSNESTQCDGTGFGNEITSNGVVGREDPELSALLKSASRMIPWDKIFFCLLFEIGIVTYTILKGPQGGKNEWDTANRFFTLIIWEPQKKKKKKNTLEKSVVGITPCSPEFFAITAATVPYFVMLAIAVGWYLNRLHRKKVRFNYPFMVFVSPHQHSFLLSLCSLLNH